MEFLDNLLTRLSLTYDQRYMLHIICQLSIHRAQEFVDKGGGMIKRTVLQEGWKGHEALKGLLIKQQFDFK